jgi:prepilin-type processing-associated H-X9-DG protein
LDARNIVDQIKLGNLDPTDSKALPYMELMACPSDPPDPSRASTSYVANCGLPDKNPLDPEQIPLNWPAGRDKEFEFTIPADWAANGPFVSRWEPGVEPRRLQRVNADSFYDGLSNTFLFSESLDATVWNDTLSRDPSTQNGYVKLGPGQWNTPEIANGFIWTGAAQWKDNAGRVVAKIINGSGTGAATEMSQCRPSSNHPGGLNVTYADGRTVFVSENIDPELYALLMTPDGRNTTPNGEPFIETPDLPVQYQQYRVWRTKVVTSSDAN